jgi:lysophospholipase L1-like esterase
MSSPNRKNCEMTDLTRGIGTKLYDDHVLGILAQLARHGRPERPIAFYGSSSFRLWPGMTLDLGTFDVVNLGFGGGTFASGLHYLDRLLVPLQPARVALYFGENDISMDGLSAEATLSGLDRLVSEITARLPHVPVFLLSAKQSPAKWLYAEVVSAFNAMAQDYCAARPGLEFIDVGQALIGENGRPMMRYYEADQIHLNTEGYGLWATLLRAHSALLV